MAEQVISQLTEEAAAFRNWNEAVRRHIAELWMGPSGQRLEADDLPGSQIDQGLIVGLYEPVPDGSAKAALDKIAFADAHIHFDFKKAKKARGGSRLGLGAIHGDIGFAHDFGMSLGHPAE